MPRIVSMLPGATARSLPKAVKNRIPTERLEPGAIDREVSSALRRGESLYQIDLELL